MPSQLFDRRTFEGRVVDNRLCLTCGFVYQSPRMTASETEAFYASEYRQLYQGSNSPNPKDLTIQALRAESLVSFFGEQSSEVKRVLDIGSSAGLLLQAFTRVFDSQVVGIEPGLAYREYAQHNGLKVYESLTELESAGESPFDLVCMAHVLEHLPDPLSYLISLREKALAGKGWLLLEVPNLYMHDSFEVAHLSAFSAHTLRQMVEKAGYQVMKLEKHGRPRSSLLPYYLLMLCQPNLIKAGRNIHPERLVLIKRRIGLFQRRKVNRIFPSLAWKSLPEERGR
jgi:2-polyprenyl-3-methyl-5-hydroxy-6-metoxy-1,4-benzoquinol methylase